MLLGCSVARQPVRVQKPSPAIVHYDMACKVLNYGADGQSSILDCGPRGIWLRQVQAGGQ